MRSVVLLLVLAAVVCAIAVAVAAEKLRVESAWSAEAPTIDGKLVEWSSPLVTLDSTAVSLGVRNDGQFLYVALASSDQAARTMLGAAGFTVWMDSTGKEKKSFGITVPPVMAGGPGMRGRGPGGDQQGMPPAEPSQEAGPGSPKGPVIGTITSIEVLGPGKDDKRRLELAYARTIGLDVAARMAEGVLVYELRVPLPVSEGQPYGVKSAPGATIGLGIETAKLQPPGGRGEEGGRGGMGGAPAGWRRRRRRAGRRHGRRRRGDGWRRRTARRDGRRSSWRRPRRHARPQTHQGLDGRLARERSRVS